MTTLDFTKKSGVTVRMPGGEYLVKKPNLAQIKQLEKDQKKNKDQWGPVTEMLESCGFPKEELDLLDSDQLSQLTEALMPEKKTVSPA